MPPRSAKSARNAGDRPIQAGPVVVLARGQVPEHVPYRPPSAPRCPLPAGFTKAGKERIQAPGLVIEQGERIEPGQLTVIGHSASRRRPYPPRHRPGVTDNIKPAAKAITRQATHAYRTFLMGGGKLLADTPNWRAERRFGRLKRAKAWNGACGTRTWRSSIVV